MRKRATIVAIALSVIATLILFVPTIASSAEGWKPGLNGYTVTKDTVGYWVHYEDPVTGEYWDIVHCPANPWNIYCQIEVPIPPCGIPDLPGYIGSDDDYYYFHAGQTSTQAYVNSATGTDSMMVPKPWLDSIWPPDTTQ